MLEQGGHRFPRGDAAARYGFACLAALAAVVAQVALTQEWKVSVYSVLVGAVALTAWYGGVGPGVLAVALATIALIAFGTLAVVRMRRWI